MKPGIFCFILFWLFLAPLNSQFSTDFSEGNLDSWQGDTADFVINGSEQLQLNAPSGTTSSWIYAPVTYKDSMSWDIYIKMDFAPSTSNQLKVYLGVNTPDLTTASGYYLEIGTSGDQDPLELKYLTNGTSETLGASAPGLAGAEPVELTIRITRNGSGLWQCYSTGAVVPELLFTASHDVLPLAGLSFFGLNCKYTDTRRDKFFFDDIAIQPVQPDNTPPSWVSINVKDANSVDLVFDEPLDETTALIPENYVLNPGNVSPDLVELNQPTVMLRWDQPLVSQQEYTLTISGLKDLSGNTMITDQKTFTYIRIEKALPYELLITEIMADPTPVIGLPDAEYLEIYNAGPGVLRLSDYSLQVGSGERILPDELIYSGEYVIICDDDHASLFSALGRTLALASFPSLTNTGATVLLKDDNGTIIHDVSYTSSWYGDPGKANGGWALEMINPSFVCSDMDNWAAADNFLGGTPGSVNSRWDQAPDLDGPSLLSLVTSAADKILLRFDERLDPLLVENPMAYSILPTTEITDAVVLDQRAVELSLVTPLQPGVVYRLLPFDIFDCLGNPGSSADTISFGLTAAPEAGDILINEILFNPASGGSRFLELQNVSQKFINLNSLAIGRIKGAQSDIYAMGIDEIIAPNQLVVLTPDPSDILSRYTVPEPSRLYKATLPAWNDKSDNVSVLSSGEIIDSLTYSSSWHLPVIADQNGVSLERVSAASPSSSASNWHSASSVSGYATPTGQNSQALSPEVEVKTPFTVTNRQFSPDDDGFKDFLALNFLLDSGDEIGSAWIYDLEGREIIRLISNESLGTSAIVQWDGRNADQVLSEMGIYIIFVQLWDANGNVREYQETCALVKR